MIIGRPVGIKHKTLQRVIPNFDQGAIDRTIDESLNADDYVNVNGESIRVIDFYTTVSEVRSILSQPPSTVHPENSFLANYNQASGYSENPTESVYDLHSLTDESIYRLIKMKGDYIDNVCSHFFNKTPLDVILTYNIPRSAHMSTLYVKLLRRRPFLVLKVPENFKHHPSVIFQNQVAPSPDTESDSADSSGDSDTVNYDSVRLQSLKIITVDIDGAKPELKEIDITDTSLYDYNNQEININMYSDSVLSNLLLNSEVTVIATMELPHRTSIPIEIQRACAYLVASELLHESLSQSARLNSDFNSNAHDQMEYLRKKSSALLSRFKRTLIPI